MTMQTHETIAGLRRGLLAARRAGRRIALVPTMGALHAGHRSLIDAARRDCDVVVVSLFVNPTQFGPTEDLERYPRTPEADLKLCVDAGVDLVFMPAVGKMYRQPPGTQVSVPSLANRLCGLSRPGHFAGVCLVVAKLFNIVGPDVAYFGAKDYQQAAIVRRMAADLDMPIQIVTCPIVREADGLAMSSRNAHLSAEHRRQASALYESLQRAREVIVTGRANAGGGPSAGAVVQAVREHLSQRAPDGRLDYIHVVDPDTLEDLERTDRPALVALAVKFGQTRLIDNILIER